jgi:hypothetical protein
MTDDTITYGGEIQRYNDLSIAFKEYHNLNHINKFGAITSVGTVFEDIWAQGGIWTPLDPAGVFLDISSSNVNDTLLGSGARTVTVSGLDINGLEIEETVEMDGQTPVITLAKFSAVNRVFVLTVGTPWAANLGIIYVADTVSAHTAGVPDTVSAVQAHISIQDGQTQLAHYTIPSDSTGYLSSIYILSGDNKTVTFEFYRYTDLQVHRIVFAGTVTDINFTKTYKPPVIIPSNWIISARAKVAVGTALVAGGFDLITKKF